MTEHILNITTNPQRRIVSGVYTGNVRKTKPEETRTIREYKLFKIKHFSEKHGVKKFDRYTFGVITIDNIWLNLLKKNIFNDEVSMFGEHNLDTLRYCTEDCLINNVQSDIIETGF